MSDYELPKPRSGTNGHGLDAEHIYKRTRKKAFGSHRRNEGAQKWDTKPKNPNKQMDEYKLLDNELAKLTAFWKKEIRRRKRLEMEGEAPRKPDDRDSRGNLQTPDRSLSGGFYSREYEDREENQGEDEECITTISDFPYYYGDDEQLSKEELSELMSQLFTNAGLQIPRGWKMIDEQRVDNCMTSLLYNDVWKHVVTFTTRYDENGKEVQKTARVCVARNCELDGKKRC